MKSSARRRRKDGFLAAYTVDEDYLQKPDMATGRPGVVGGRDPDGNSVLIREWRRSTKAPDSDLEQIWRHELRQLHRLAGYPGSASCIAHLHDAGFDARGFYLVIAPGQRQPLESLLVKVARPDAHAAATSWSRSWTLASWFASPPPTSSRSPLAQRMHAERDGLVEVRLKIGFNKAPWKRRFRIITRRGRLSEQEE